MLGRGRFHLAWHTVQALMQQGTQRPAGTVTTEHVQVVNVQVCLTVSLAESLSQNGLKRGRRHSVNAWRHALPSFECLGKRRGITEPQPECNVTDGQITLLQQPAGLSIAVLL